MWGAGVSNLVPFWLLLRSVRRGRPARSLPTCVWRGGFPRAAREQPRSHCLCSGLQRCICHGPRPRYQTGPCDGGLGLHRLPSLPSDGGLRVLRPGHHAALEPGEADGKAEDRSRGMAPQRPWSGATLDGSSAGLHPHLHVQVDRHCSSSQASAPDLGLRLVPGAHWN